MQKNNKANHPDWTILKLLNWTTSYFKSHDIDSPRAAAEILLAHSLNVQRIDLYVQYDQPLNGDELSDFKHLIKRRAAREPVAYITGLKEFWGLEMMVTGDVLIPRPETEILVETVLANIPEIADESVTHEPFRILELGTGSGALIISIARERKRHAYFASDISAKALAVAARNAACHNVKNKIRFFSGNWFESINQRASSFHVIVSNPPYIKSGDIPQLQPEIYRYEPKLALDGCADGLDCIRRIIGSAHHFLHDGGVLVMEIGHDQSAAVEAIAREVGYYETAFFVKDYNGYDRVAQMRKKTLRT